VHGAFEPGHDGRGTGRGRDRLLLVGSVHHVAETLLHGRRIVVIGLTRQDGLHAAADSLFMVPVRTAVVGGASLEQLHGPHIGTVAPGLEGFLQKRCMSLRLALEHFADDVAEGVLVRVLWARQVGSTMGVGDSRVRLRKRTAVSLVEGWGVDAVEFDHLCEVIDITDSRDGLCLVVRGHCGSSDVRAARVPLVLPQISAAAANTKEWFSPVDD